MANSDFYDILQSNAYAMNVQRQQRAAAAAQQAQQSWYTGNQPTSMEIRKRISEIYKTDPDYARSCMQNFYLEQQNPGSYLYEPYKSSTNGAADKLKEYGFDVSQLNREWFDTHHDWEKYLVYNGTTGTPTNTTSGKKYTKEQKMAYQLWQYGKSIGTTEDVATEWAAMKEELAFLANDEALNLSAEEIVNKVRGEMKQKYPTLYKLDYSISEPGQSLVELNHGTDYSMDAMYGAVWAAWNDGGTGNSEDDIYNYLAGNGKMWEFDQAKADRVNPSSPSFQPYANGATKLDEACMYFGRYSFDDDFINENNHLVYDGNPTEQKLMKELVKGNNNAKEAEAALNALSVWSAAKKSGWKTAAQAKTDFDTLLAKGYVYIGTGKREGKVYTDDGPNRVKVSLSILNKMDASIGKEGVNQTGDLVPMSRGINYKYSDYVASLEAMFGADDTKDTNAETVNRLNPGTQPSPSPAPEAGTPDAQEPKPDKTTAELVDEEKDKRVASAVNTLGDKLTDTEMALFDAMPSINGMSLAKGIYSIKQGYFANGKKIEGPVDVQKLTDPEWVMSMATKQLEKADDDYLATGFESLQIRTEYEKIRDEDEILRTRLDQIEGKYGDILMAREPVNDIESVEIGGTPVTFIRGEDGKYTFDPVSEELPDEVFQNTYGMSRDELVKTLEQKAQNLTDKAEAVEWAQKRIEAKTEIDEIVDIDTGASIEIPYVYDELNKKYILSPAFDSRSQEVMDYLAATGEDENQLWKTINNKIDELNETIKGPNDTELNYIHSRMEQTQSYLKQNEEAYNQAVGVLDKANQRRERIGDITLRRSGMMIDPQSSDMVLDFVSGFTGYETPADGPISLVEDLANAYTQDGAVFTEENRREIEDYVTGLDAYIQTVQSVMDNYDLPEYYRQKMSEKTAYLESRKRLYNAFLITQDENFEQLAKQGRNLGAALELAIKGRTTGLAFGVISDLEKDIMLALYERDGYEAAKQFYDDIEGSLLAQYEYNTNKGAKAVAESGFLGRVFNELASITHVVTEIPLNVAYLETSIIGKEDKWLRAPSHFAKAANEATIKELHNLYDGTVWGTILPNLAEMINNRGRSMMAGMVFGGMIPEGASDIVNAMPIATVAFGEAYEEAKENGMNDVQAYTLGIVNFLCESVTEGIEFGHFKGLFDGNVTLKTFKDYFAEKLFSFGWLSEATGETVNNILERTFNRIIAGDKSEHNKRIQQYINSGMCSSIAEAEEMVAWDYIKEDMHTAIVSALSSFLDVGPFAMRKAASTIKYAAKAGWYNRTHSDSITIKDLQNRDRRIYATMQQMQEREANNQPGIMQEAPAQKSERSENQPVQTQPETSVQQDTAPVQAETNETAPAAEEAAPSGVEIYQQEQGKGADQTVDEAISQADVAAMNAIDTTQAMSNEAGKAALDALGNRLGVKVVLTRGLPDGRRSMYSRGRIYLNSDMVNNGDTTIGQALVESSLYEITHMMEQSKSYEAYRTAVLDALYNGDNIAYRDALDAKKSAHLEQFGQELSTEQAEQEILAEFAMNNLSDEGTVQRLMNSGLGAKIRNALHNINQALKNFRLKGKERETAENLRKAERAFQKALDEASKTKIYPQQNRGYTVNRSRAVSADEYDTDTVLLENAVHSEQTAVTSTIAAVLRSPGQDENTANAAAVAFVNRYGSDAIAQLQSLLDGGRRGDVNINTLKAGIRYAALANGESAQTVASEDFQSAAPEVQAQMLADAAQEDAANSDVQNEVKAAVHDMRVAEAEKEALSAGEASEIESYQEKADEAAREVYNAEQEYNDRVEAQAAARENVSSVTADFLADPSDDNMKRKTQAENDLAAADAVAKEYEQSVKKYKGKHEKAESDLNKAKDEALTRVREEAEARVAQEEQQEAVEAEQRAVEQERVQAEQAEADAVATENNNIARMDADEFMAQNRFNELSEEEQQKVRETFARIQSELSPDAFQRREKFVKQVSKKFGVDIVFTDTTQGGKVDRQNGYYDRRSGRIVLDETSSLSDAMYFVLGHELTHMAEASGTYNDLADALIKIRYGDNRAQLDADTRIRKELYDNRLAKMHEQDNSIDATPLTEDEARQEIVADIMGQILQGDQELANQLASQQPNIVRRIISSIKNFINKMKGVEGPWKTDAQNAVDMLEKALKDAQNQQTGEERGVSYSVPEERVAQPDAVDNDGNELTATIGDDTEVKFSLSSWTDKEIETVRKSLKKKGFSEQEIKKWIGDVNDIAKFIVDNKDTLDFVPDRKQKFKKPNGDVYKWTLDASTLCAKRLLYQGTFNAIQKLMPNTPLYAGDLIELSNMMREMGYQTPCGICYVESQRRDTGKFTEEFIEKYSKEHEGEFIPTYADLTTSDGLYKLRDEHHDVYDAYIKANNARGSASTKPVQLRTDYRGDVRTLTEDSVKYLNSIGGLRIQSFSDFETPHLMDMMQAVLDMTAKGLKSQAYTKVPNFAWVFGDTGIKINLSLMGEGTGVDENGNLIFSSKEGMDFEEAMKLRNRYSQNVGTILVGMNDAHILAAMADPRIDYIIPFHRSGWSEENRAKMTSLANYKDYQDYQNERDIKTGKKAESNLEPLGPDGYWEFDLTGKENAEKYLKLCAEKGLIPKFEQFLVNNGDGSYSLQPDGSTDGYWKTLIDVKMYDNDGNKAPQQVVNPNINMTEAFRVLAEFDGTGVNSLPVAQDVVDKYVEEYKAKHPLNENRTKYSLPSDASYMAAVERGEMDEVQRMADDAARNAGYNVKLYHGTDSFGFTVPDPRSGDDMISFFATDNPEVAKTYSYDADIRKLTDRLPFTEKDLKTRDGFYRNDKGILEYLDKLGIKYKEGGKNQYGHETIEVPEWGTPLANIHPGLTGTMPYRGEMHEIAAELYRIYLHKNNINTAFGVAPQRHTVGIYQLYGKTDGMLEIDGNYENWDSVPYDLKGMLAKDREQLLKENPDDDFIPYEWEDTLYDGEATTRQIARYAYDKGYPGVIIRNVFDNGGKSKNRSVPASTVYIFFNPQQQVKSADPVTYDDNGNVIPLSERFNTGSPDIRYSLPSDTYLEQYIRDYISNNNARPLEGMNPAMSTGNAPAVRGFASANGMLKNSDEMNRFAKAVTLAQNTYYPDTNEEQIQRAVNWIGSLKQTPNSDGYAEALQAVTSNDFDYRSADGQARMVAVIGLANAKNDTMAQVALADAFMRQGTDLGRALQARKIFKLMTPEGRISTLMNTLRSYSKNLKDNGIQADLKFSHWIYQMAAAAESAEDFRKVQIAAANELAAQLPITWKERINSLRMLSMLANPRTHIRNVIGNALFIPAVSIKNKLSAVAELGMEKGKRTKTLAPVLDADIRRYAISRAKAIQGELTGEAKFSENALVSQAKKPLGKTLGWLSDFNSKALEKEDWIFLKGHFRRAFGGWVQANGYTVEQLENDAGLREQGEAYAIQEAQKATYRDFSKTAQTLNNISRNGGVPGFLVDAAMPFKKTPMNILKRGIEYSPAGIAKGLYNLSVNMKKGKVTPTQVIDQICSGLSGTGVMTLGYLLAGAGAASCGFGDDDEDEFEKAKGNQEYAINPGKALNTLFGAKLFGEDVTFTLDWAAPMSMPFFVGVAIRNQMEKEGNLNAEDMLNALGSMTEPVFNLSMMDGVNSLLKVNSYDNSNPITQIGGRLVTNYASSFVPSALGAITRTFFDDTQRKSFVEQGKGGGFFGNVRYAIESAQNKIPGQSKTNIPVRDIWGEAQTSEFAERLIENFISPGYVNNYEEDPVINEMARLFDATGDKSMIPKADPDKTITYMGDKRVLTAEQWDQYKETRGKTAHTMLNELIESSEYRNADDATQVKMIENVWSYANKVGQNAVFPEIEVEGQGPDVIGELARDADITTKKANMIKALEQGDYEGYEAMVEALRDADVEDSAIKERISSKYINKYKEAYRLYLTTGDDKYYEEMSEIEETLDSTGYSFNIEGWMEKVEEKLDNQ